MKKPFCLLLVACASLAVPAHAAPKTVITSLPFAITTAGTYVLKSDLNCPSGVDGIHITADADGPIILDLDGHTITGPGDEYTAGVTIGNISVTAPLPDTYPITVRNGILKNFTAGVFVSIATATGAVAYASDITLSHLEIDASTAENSFAISFYHVNSSTVKGCTLGHDSTSI